MSADRHLLAADAAAAGAPGGSPGRAFLRRFLARPLAVASLIVLLLLAAASAAVPLVEQALGFTAEQIDLLARAAPPSASHPLGTDELGRDLLLRLLHGGRVSLGVGLAAALVAATLGTTVGLLAGYLGGRVDDLLMRLADSVIALPLLPLLIVLAALDLTKLGLSPAFADSGQANLWRIVLLVALVGWTTTARLVRGTVLSLKAREYVRAAEALGASPARILWRHVLPNALSPVIVATTLSVGNVILLESVLSFLGLGIQPPLPSWGNMLTGAQETLWSAPMLAVWPGLAIFVTVIAANLLGDGLQDALDPRTDRR